MISRLAAAHLKARFHRVWGLNARAWEDLAEHLASLLEAGLPMLDGLDCLAGASPQKAARERVVSARVAVEQGISLSQAWQDDLPSLLLLLVRAGEETGQLADALRCWVEYSRQRRGRWTEWLRVVSYPAGLLLMIGVLMVFVSRVLLPTFASLYTELKVPMSPVTADVERALAALPGIVGLAPCVIGAVLGLIALASRYLPLRQWRAVQRRLPGIVLWRLGRTQSLCLTLRLLIGAGVPLSDALRGISDTGRPTWLRQTALQAVDHVMAGRRLADIFPGEWDPMLGVLLRWAEQTGELEVAFARVERYAAARLQSRLRLAVRVAEPALMGVMGLLVTLSMYVVYVPMYDLMTAVAGGGMANADNLKGDS